VQVIVLYVFSTATVMRQKTALTHYYSGEN